MKGYKAIFGSLCLIYCLIYLPINTAQSANDDSSNFDCHEGSNGQDRACYEKALKYYQIERASDYDNLDAWYKESDAYYHMGDYAASNYVESYQLCDQVLENKDFQGKKELTKFRTLQGDCDIAYEKATGERITAGPGHEEPEAYLAALMLYDEAIRMDPNNTHAWNNKGVALAEMHNFTGSIYCFNKTIEIDPTIAEAWNNKGAALCDLDLYGEALAYFNNSTMRNGLVAEAWYNKGRSLDELGMPGSEECYSKGKELNEQLMEEAEFKWLYKRL
jgi:tetratricopeptide (TPR) repeat protein